MIDAGQRFCGDTNVPAAVVLDLFQQSCGGGGGGGGGGTGATITLATARSGPVRAVLSATQTSASRGSVYLTLYRGGLEYGQPQLGVQNQFVWSQLRRPRSGFISLNPAVGYVGAAVLVNPRQLYLGYQFKLTANGWAEVASPATP